jgi:hypothetical protein
VLGNGRSGTSMVTRMLGRAGFHVGSDERLLASDEANPEGYFERTDVLDANERILAELDGTWYSPPPPNRLAAARDRFAPTLHALLDGLLGEAGTAPLALKDPRIGALIGLWQPLLEGLLHPVLAIRHPLEIARSLATRDETPIPISLAAWEVHMSGLLGALDGRLVTVVQHRELLADPRVATDVVALARARLAPERTAHVDPAAAAAAIEPRLHRNRAGDGAADQLTARQARLWELLERLPSGDVRLQAPAELRAPTEAALDAVRHEAQRDRSAGALRRELGEVRQALHEQGQSSRQLQREVASLRELSAQLAERERERGERADRLAEELAISEQRRQRAEQTLAAVRLSVSWRLTVPLRAAKRRLVAGGRRLGIGV